SSPRQRAQYTSRAPHACTTGIGCTASTRNNEFQTVVIRYATLKKWPDSVCNTALTACAKPAPKNITASNKAPATIRHFTQAESAIASRERTAIQIREESTRLAAIHRLVQVQLAPARLACIPKRINPGIHVICESRIASTEDLPSRYCARDNGRYKYNGSAPLARSGEIRPGPGNAVKRNASTPCTLMKRKKNSLSIDRTRLETPSSARKLALWAR